MLSSLYNLYGENFIELSLGLLMPDHSELKTRSIENYEKFFSKKTTEVELSPAGFILLGDHTHYNEGLLIGCALSFYSAVILHKRNDNKIRLKVGDAKLYEFDTEGVSIPSGDFNTTLVIEIIKILKENELIDAGFDCYIESYIPRCAGLGYYSSIIMGFLNSINTKLSLGIEINELLEIGYKAQKVMIGQIANKATLLASLVSKENSFIHVDLRKKEPEYISTEKKLQLIIFDTGEKIDNPQMICNERIDECNVGVKGLRLYIWGIKNLRDIKPDFLAKHIHMIPRRVYNRCLYNVDERLRVEEILNAKPENKLQALSENIFNSHKSLSELYDLSTQKIDYLVKKASDSDLFFGAKMISCSSFRSLYAIVEENNAEAAIKELSEKYSEKYEGTLNTFVLNIVKGSV